jgi:uncharacterized RDD family membrane protein YckC
MTGFRQKEADSSFRVETPEGIEFVLYPAGLPIRACAYGIDTAVQWVILITVFILFYLAEQVAGIWLIMLIQFAVDWFYHVFCEQAFRGQTLGKRLMGIRVVGNDGAPVPPGGSFLRNLLRFADGFMGLHLIALICLLMSRGFRRIGDWAAGTLVVYTNRSLVPDRGPLMSWISDVEVVTPGRTLSSEEKQAILMFARRYPLLGPARADEIARPMAASLRGESGGPSGIGDGEPRNRSAAETGSDSAYLLGVAHRFSGDAL